MEQELQDICMHGTSLQWNITSLQIMGQLQVNVHGTILHYN